MSGHNRVEQRLVDKITRAQEYARDCAEVRRRRAEAARVEPLARALVDNFIAQIDDPEPHLRALGSAVHAATVRNVGVEDAAALFGVLARVGAAPERPAPARAAADRAFKKRVA